MLHVTLYKYVYKPIIVDKTAYLGTGLSMEGNALSGNQDMEYPVILLHFSAEPDYNYAYIQEYHRWYYVNNKTWVGGDVWSLNFSVDELYTYRALVRSLDGIVAYSANGSGLKYDSRLVYNKPPVRTQEVTASTIKAPSTFYVVMPTAFFNSNGVGKIPKNNMRYYIFPLDSFWQFMSAYSSAMSDDSQLATAAGELIQQLLLVTWLDPNDFVNYEYVTSGVIRFDSPEINALGEGGSSGGWDFEFDNSQNPVPYYIAYDDTVHRGLNLAWRVINPVFWTRKAKRCIYIPFVGKIDIDLDSLGVGETTDMYVGVNIRYDFTTNAYVVSPGYSSPQTGPDNFDAVIDTSLVRVPNQYATPFTVDTSYQYYSETTDRQALSILNNFVGGAMNVGQTQGLMLPQLISNTASDIANLGITGSILQYQEAASLQVYGSCNGGSSDTVLINQIVDAGGNIQKLYPTAFMETLIIYASEGYNTYWSEHGMPDGAHRSLSNISGYTQMKEFEMKYDSNATIGEMSRLEAQLYKGVIL